MNSIRTPRAGCVSWIAKAVDDEGWQTFRVGLKGTSTEYKLEQLAAYYDGTEVRKIRVDNYLKALARGGLIRVERDYIARLVKGNIRIK